MITKILNGQEVPMSGSSSSSPQTAGNVTYDNTDSGLVAINVQDAIDEVNSGLEAKADETEVGNLATLTTTDKTSLVGAVNEINAGLATKADETEVQAIVNVYGNKNLLEDKIISDTFYGVTFTRNLDGSFLMNGSNSDTLAVDVNSSFKLPKGSYILSAELEFTLICQLVLDDLNGNRIATLVNANDAAFTLNSETALKLYVWFDSAQSTLTNALCKPMIRLASIKDSTYVPYTKTNKELTEDTTLIKNFYGAKNLFNKDSIESGLLKSDGTILVASGWYTSDYIPLYGNYLCVSGSAGGSSSSGFSFYDSNKTFVSNVALQFFLTNPLLQIPLTAKYCRISCGDADINSLQVELGSEITPYAPYAKTNKELTEDTEQIEPILNVYGAKNLFPMSVDSIKARNTIGTWNGNVYSIGNATITILLDNNSITGLKINGTPNGNIYFYPYYYSMNFLTAGNAYIINGGDTDAPVRAYHYDGTHTVSSTGNDASFISDGSSGTVDIVISSGVTYNDVIVRPMIRDARIKDSTYVPYAMTNSKLTATITKLVTGTFTATLSVGDNVMNTVDGSATSIVTSGTIPPYPEYCLYIVDSIGTSNNATFSIHMDGGGTHKIIHVVTNTAQLARVRWYRVGIQDY